MHLAALAAVQRLARQTPMAASRLPLGAASRLVEQVCSLVEAYSSEAPVCWLVPALPSVELASRLVPALRLVAPESLLVPALPLVQVSP
jgi:hypothetical protein